MGDEEGTIAIRSYRVCFDLERRLHKIDRWRVPLPYGLPLRSIGYFGGALLAILILMRLPVTGTLLGVLHPAIRFLLLPTAGAFLLTRWTIDGRMPHAAGLAWLRMWFEPKRVSAFRPAEALGKAELGQVTLAPDGRGARLRKGVISGPARIIVRYPTRMQARGKTLRLSQEGTEAMWRGKQINLRQGQRVVVE